MKIPKDVSIIRRKMAQARVARERGAVQQAGKPANQNQSDAERVKKARDEAAKARILLREKDKSDAEKDMRIQELQEALDAANARLVETEPAAKRWNEFSHKEKEILLQKLPKEMHKDARDMDIKHLKLFVSNYTGETGAAAGKPPVAGTKIGSLKDAETATPAAYNEFMDGIKAGTIKLDSEGKVLA